MQADSAYSSVIAYCNPDPNGSHPNGSPTDFTLIKSEHLDQVCFECQAGSPFPVHSAASNGHVYCMKNLFLNLINTEILLDATNSTPLHAAAASGQTESLKFLIEFTRIPINHQNCHGETCAHVAALNRRLDCLKLLLGGSFKKSQSLAFVRDVFGCTVLHCAVLVGHNDGALWLLQRFGKTIANIANEDDVLPLHVAAAQGNIEFIRFATKYDSHMVNKRDRNGASAVFYAVQGGYLHCLKYLVEKDKANVRIVTKRGHSLVHAACLNGHLDIVEYLFTKVDKSAVCQQTRDAATPFHCAAYSGQCSILKLLYKVSGGKRLLVLLTDGRGNTSLHLAALKGHAECVDFLLKLGSDPEVRNRNGQTPIDIALKRNYPEIARQLAASVDGSQIITACRDDHRSYSRRSLKLVRPHSMSTSGYSTAAHSDGFENDLTEPHRRRRHLRSSGYASSSSAEKLLMKQKSASATWTVKTIQVQPQSDDSLILSSENWLLRKKLELGVDDAKRQKVKPSDLVNSEVQTDFDPLTENIIIVDDYERIIFSSVPSVQMPFYGKHEEIKTSSDSLDSCTSSGEFQRQQQNRRRAKAKSRNVNVSPFDDKSSSDAEIKEIISDVLNDSKSVSSRSSSVYKQKISVINIDFNRITNGESEECVQDRKVPTEREFAQADANNGKPARNTVSAIVHQSMENVVVEDGRWSSSTIRSAEKQNSSIGDEAINSDPSMEPAQLSLPLAHNPNGQVDEPSEAEEEKTLDDRNVKRACDDSANSISLTDVSRIGSRMSVFDANRQNPKTPDDFTLDVASHKSNDRRSTKDCCRDSWKESKRQQLLIIPPVAPPMPRNQSNHQAKSRKPTPQIVQRSNSPMSRALSPSDREMCRNRVAEIRKRLELHFCGAQPFKPPSSKEDRNHASPVRTSNSSSSANSSILDESSKSATSDSEIPIPPANRINYRFFGTSNGSDDALRKNILNHQGARSSQRQESSAERNSKTVAEIINNLKETNIDSDVCSIKSFSSQRKNDYCSSSPSKSEACVELL